MSWLRFLTATPAIHSIYRNLARRTVVQYHTAVGRYSPFSCVISPLPFCTFMRPTVLQWAIQQRHISTLKRRVFKIKKHKKKKRKKKLSRISILPWRPSEERKVTYLMPYKMRRIVKERRRRNKGNRTLRVPRQR